MAINKVVYSDQTLIDLTGDTVNAENLGKGFVAHDKSGSVVTGVAKIASQTYYTGTTDPPSSLGSDGDLYFKMG